jgi:O-antigen biosynthesis protein
MKKIVFVVRKILSGCAYARAIVPSKSINLFSKNFSSIVVEEINEKIINETDIIIWQRQMDNKNWDIFNLAKNKGIIQLYDIDDNLHEIPKYNDMYGLLKQGSFLYENIIKWMFQCDGIIVSSNNLKKYYSNILIKKNIEVIPNKIEADNICAPVGSNNIIKILYAGSESHKKDVEIILPCIAKLKENLGDTIEIIFVGMKCNYNYATNIKQVTPQKYEQVLSGLKCDIGLCPIEKTTFNKSKTAIKWMEYTRSGIASIATNCSPYSDLIINNKTGVLVENKSNEWYEAIYNLIYNKNKRINIVTNAQRDVVNNHNYHDLFIYYEKLFNFITQNI